MVRRNSQDGAVQIKIASDAMRPCTEEEVRTLLPIQAYSQKQLSDVSVRVEELSRFITAPVRSELNRIEQQASDRAERIRQTYATRRRQRSLTQTLQKRELEEHSLTGQADALRAALTGLSGEDRALLDTGKVFDAADRSVRSWQDGATSVRAGATGLLSTIDSYLSQPDIPPTQPEEAILKAAHAEYLSLLSDAKTNLEALVARAGLITGEGRAAAAVNPWREWAEKMSAFKTSYEAAVQRSSAHSEKMKQLRDIEEQLDKQRGFTKMRCRWQRIGGNHHRSLSSPVASNDGDFLARQVNPLIFHFYLVPVPVPINWWRI